MHFLDNSNNCVRFLNCDKITQNLSIVENKLCLIDSYLFTFGHKTYIIGILDDQQPKINISSK